MVGLKFSLCSCAVRIYPTAPHFIFKLPQIPQMQTCGSLGGTSAGGCSAPRDSGRCLDTVLVVITGKGQLLVGGRWPGLLPSAVQRAERPTAEGPRGKGDVRQSCEASVRALRVLPAEFPEVSVDGWWEPSPACLCCVQVRLDLSPPSPSISGKEGLML